MRGSIPDSTQASETPVWVCVLWGQNRDLFSTEHPATDRKVTMGFTQAIHSPTSCTLCAWQLPGGSSSVVMCRGSLQGNHKASPAGAAGKGRKTGVRSGWERGFKPQESFSGLGWGLWPRRIDRGASGHGTWLPRSQTTEMADGLQAPPTGPSALI